MEKLVLRVTEKTRLHFFLFFVIAVIVISFSFFSPQGENQVGMKKQIKITVELTVNDGVMIEWTAVRS